ncbi:MAG: hypothetical protein FK731_07750 [Asgard group archaeon]|nr:hypothetical protein [Asgard group archaeon]
MLVYPGGTVNDDTLDKHYFLKNYFSDLGRINALNGEYNLSSRVLFMIALILVAIVILFYFITILPLFNEKKNTRLLSIFGTIGGIFCAIAYIGIAIVPLDLNDVAHGTFVFISFTATLVTLILYVIAIFLTNKISNFYAWVYIVLGIILLGYLFLLYGYNYIEVFRKEIVQVVGQRLVVYGEIVTFVIQGIGTLSIAHKANLLINKKVEDTNNL